MRAGPFALGAAAWIALAASARGTLLLSTTDYSAAPLTENNSQDDPELTNGVSPPPEPGSQPPPFVRLPDIVIRKDEWRGSQCGVAEERRAVFRHAPAWDAFWRQGVAPYSEKLRKVPAVDFSKDMVVGVFLGEKPSPHYQIEIISVKTETQAGQGPALVVRYRDIERMIGVFVPPFPVQPFDLKRVPFFDGPVVFEKVKR